jgi:LysM repeat protein
MVKQLPPAPAALLTQKFPGQNPHLSFHRGICLAALVLLLTQFIAACVPAAIAVQSAPNLQQPTKAPPTPTPAVTPLPTRPIYQPGQLVDYTAQMGDTLPALAARFNTTIKEIRTANPVIPADVTTMPPGMPLKIPIYYQPFWGSTFEIIPDSLFINGPEQQNFDPVAFVNKQPGWFKSYDFFVDDKTQKGGQLVAQIAMDYSISPRLLLALIEYQTGALSQAQKPEPMPDYPLGYINYNNNGLYRQLLWAANLLNDGYYSWREGRLKEFDLRDGRVYRLDPWINASTASLQNYFARIFTPEIFNTAIHGEGLARAYQRLFGDPWINVKPHIPVNLRQPDLKMPFLSGHTWAYTGGPHTGWGDSEPFSAIDFAPPTAKGGCSISSEFATAVADGVIARTGPAIAVLDLDGDGDERTGWVVFYLHLSSDSPAPLGARLKTGDPIGHPSCEGGRATGTHVHIARKYNGEWIPADGTLAFNLEGWVVNRGSQAYEGTLIRQAATIRACTCSDQGSFVLAGQ